MKCVSHLGLVEYGEAHCAILSDLGIESLIVERDSSVLFKKYARAIGLHDGVAIVRLSNNRNAEMRGAWFSIDAETRSFSIGVLINDSLDDRGGCFSEGEHMFVLPS
jgi:hypothetical protein